MGKNPLWTAQSSVMTKYIITGLGALCGYLVYSFLIYSQLEGERSTDSIILPYIAAMIIGSINAWGIVMINNWFNERFPWRRGILIRLMSGYLIQSLFIIFTSTSLIVGGLLILRQGHSYQDVVNLYGADFIKFCIIVPLGLIVYNVIYFAFYSYKEYAVVQIETVANERRQLQLQLEALKSQLKPHYLFNSLNTISSLLYKDASLTERFIRRLAETYQYILSTQKLQYVSLAEEIEFVRSYHFLLKVRFEENIFLEINIPPTLLKTRIPPLTMQMLVENAIKHNVITKEKPLFIYISAIDNTVLKVMNTKTQSPLHTTSFNIGLKNIKKRYNMLSNHEIKVIDDSKFEVHLPVIKEQKLSA